jgi:hypothetical protein
LVVVRELLALFVRGESEDEVRGESEDEVRGGSEDEVACERGE